MQQSELVAGFLADIESVCRKYALTISLEDLNSGFVIHEYEQSDIELLYDASLENIPVVAEVVKPSDGALFLDVMMGQTGESPMDKRRVLARLLRMFAVEVQEQQMKYRQVQGEHSHIEGLLDHPVEIQTVVEAQSISICAIRDKADALERGD